MHAAVGLHDMADPVISFNSLFEMRNVSAAVGNADDRTLSILYLRCRVETLISDGGLFGAFNSLFEMPGEVLPRSA